MGVAHGQMYNTPRWHKLRGWVLARDGYRCWMCGGAIPEDPGPGYNPWGGSVDHVTPVAHGGDRWNPGNLRAAHLICNVRAGASVRRRDAAYRVRREW